MKYFHYAGQMSNGLHAEGWLLANDRDDAVEVLRQRRIQPLYVREGPGHIPLRVPVEELLASLRELASLRQSGMPLDQALDAVAESVEHGELKRGWMQVGRSVRAGLSLSDALASVPHVFPRYAVPMVRVGEASGALKSALQSVADRLEEEMTLRNEVRSALVYPAFLMAISIGVVLFLFLAVIPRFSSMMGDMADGGPWSMRVLIAIAEWLQAYFWLWIGILGGGVLVLVHQARQGALQAQAWSFFQRVPGIRNLMDAWMVVQFCGSMHRLLGQGVSLLEALQLSSETVGQEDVQRRLMLAAGLVRQGMSLSEALERQRLFSPLVLQIISTGEASASLAESMSEIRQLHERRLREGIRRILALLEPAVIVILGLVVGSIMVSLLSGIMSMNDLPL